jgi:hypothetical protein
MPGIQNEQAVKVRPVRACRGLRAWHAKREKSGTWEAPASPGILTARFNRVKILNDKKRFLMGVGESDRLIVVRGKGRRLRTGEGADGTV